MSRRGETPFSGHPRIPCSAAGAPLQPDVAAGVITWPPRCYACSFCGREFNSAQALGGHMNIHRRDRARLRTNSDHHSSSSTHHDWPPTAITDRNTPLPLSISSNSAGFGSTHLHPPFQTAVHKYCSQDPSSSVTYNSSPIGNISGAAPPFKLQGSTSVMIPASDQRPIDFNSSSEWPSIHSIPRVICVSNSANSPAALHSPQFPKSSSFITSPELMQGTPLNADLLICGAAEAAASRAPRSSHVGVAGTHVRVHELIQFKELAYEVEHSKWRSRGELGLLNDPIQRPLQHCIQRPCSTVAKDSTDCHERGIPVSSSPIYKDSMGCLDLELRLGRRSCLSAERAAASPGNSNMQPPSPPDHDRRPP